ncbi:hypothetical protein LCGC14_1263430 [marine sediment metagenome]|uniref:Uncharacterized protein n=1 Tax=marine sediment metagenome TaxID=412755 RepID=A0A0F9P3E2_9ZZZZ
MNEKKFKLLNTELSKSRNMLHRYSTSHASCSDIDECDMFLGCISVIKEDIKNMILQLISLKNEVQFI